MVIHDYHVLAMIPNFLPLMESILPIIFNLHILKHTQVGFHISRVKQLFKVLWTEAYIISLVSFTVCNEKLDHPFNVLFIY